MVSACASARSSRSMSTACTCRRRARMRRRLINEKGPRRASLRMLRDVDADSFVSAFTDGLRANLTEAQMTSLKPQIDAFSVTLKSIGEAKKGDVINFDYTPDGGTRISVNGQPKGHGDPGTRLLLRRHAHLARRQAGRRWPENGPAWRLTMPLATASSVRPRSGCHCAVRRAWRSTPTAARLSPDCALYAAAGIGAGHRPGC